jgi:hypothetical protein
MRGGFCHEIDVQVRHHSGRGRAGRFQLRGGPEFHHRGLVLRRQVLHEMPLLLHELLRREQLLRRDVLRQVSKLLQVTRWASVAE